MKNNFYVRCIVSCFLMLKDHLQIAFTHEKYIFTLLHLTKYIQKFIFQMYFYTVFNAV